MKKILSVFVFLLIIFSFTTTVASAQSSSFNSLLPRKIASTEASLKQEKDAMKASASAARQARKDALSEVKVAACEARQAAIQKRSESIVKRAQTQQKTFTQIAQRVEQFYNEKVVPAGESISNYEVLVADIATKEAAIAPLLETAQNDATNFSCDKDRPADQVLTFNKDMKAVTTALEAFKKSVRNLIVAVRKVAPLEKSATDSTTTK